MTLRADKDIILAKASIVRKCTATIRSLPSHDPPLDPWLVQDVTLLNLQRAIQACLDITHHIIAANGWELPSSARQAFEIAARHGFLRKALLPAMVSAAGFRNVAVHEYTALAPAAVAAIVRDNLADLEGFADDALLSIQDTP